MTEKITEHCSVHNLRTIIHSTWKEMYHNPNKSSTSYRIETFDNYLIKLYSPKLVNMTLTLGLTLDWQVNGFSINISQGVHK